MNTKIGNLNLKQVGIAVLAAVLIAAWKLVGPALDTASQNGQFIINWVVVGYSALNAFMTTLVALFLTDENGRPLGIGKK